MSWKHWFKPKNDCISELGHHWKWLKFHHEFKIDTSPGAINKMFGPRAIEMCINCCKVRGTAESLLRYGPKGEVLEDDSSRF
jgi:hypothetical protein